jgi:hypothetical protein
MPGPEKEAPMKLFARLTLGTLLLAALLVSAHSEPVAAQTATETEEEAPETFVPTEKLPADSAISFPIDI